MQINLVLNGTNYRQHAAHLRTLADTFEKAEDVATDEMKSNIDMSEMRKRAAKGFITTKAEAEEEITEPSDDMPEAEDTAEFESDDDFTADEEPEEKAPAKKAAAAKTITIDGDIIPAFKAFAKKHSREKAQKVLAKFKVKSARDIATKDFAAVLKMLGA